MAENENRHCTVALHRCEGTVESHLFLVTLTRTEPGNIPFPSQYFVLAPDEREAISQVESLPFDSLYLDNPQRDSLTATAVRVPFLIRGWGRQVF